MPDIQLHRPHQLGLPAARQAAQAWARKAREKFALECTYHEADHGGGAHDTLRFHRPGIEGTLQVHADHFNFTAELGFVPGLFKDRIEAEIGAQFDALLRRPAPPAPEHPAA